MCYTSSVYNGDELSEEVMSASSATSDEESIDGESEVDDRASRKPRDGSPKYDEDTTTASNASNDEDEEDEEWEDDYDEKSGDASSIDTGESTQESDGNSSSSSEADDTRSGTSEQETTDSESSADENTKSSVRMVNTSKTYWMNEGKSILLRLRAWDTKPLHRHCKWVGQLSKVSPETRRLLIQSASHSQLNTFGDKTYNLLNGRVPLHSGCGTLKNVEFRESATRVPPNHLEDAFKLTACSALCWVEPVMLNRPFVLWFQRAHYTDGFPVIAVTPESVHSMMVTHLLHSNANISKTMRPSEIL